jgi:superfamily II DNA helicase RecQ
MMEEARNQAQASATAATAAATPPATSARVVDCIKGVVYCRSRKLCEQLATALRCYAYHAGVASRAEILQEWRQAGGLIVCTSALGVGVDIPSVRFTLHVD